MPLAVSGFSEDGRWWWDGQRWIGTSDVVIPDLPVTEFERTGKLDVARRRMKRQKWLHDASVVQGLATSGLVQSLGLAVGLPFLVVQRRALRDYRAWTLEQLAAATTHLLGPSEPMVAGETSLHASYWLDDVARDLAVVVTAARVLVLRIDHLDGQPRWVSLVAHPGEVNMQFYGGPFGYKPTLVVRHANDVFAIQGFSRVFEPQPVLAAWRQAAAGRVKT